MVTNPCRDGGDLGFLGPRAYLGLWVSAPRRLSEEGLEDWGFWDSWDKKWCPEVVTIIGEILRTYLGRPTAEKLCTIPKLLHLGRSPE